MNKFSIGVIIVIIALFGGMVIYNSVQKKDNGTDYSVYDASKIINDTENTGGIAEHVRGKADSAVVLVEYADFQCPGCASMMPKIDKLYEKYKDKVAFVFRNYPITGHQNARSAAAAAESANLQGYFWEMASALYANRTDWIAESGESRTEKYVEIFKVAAPEGDVDAFKKELESNKNFEKKINFDVNIGRERSKVSATPAFYVNGDAIPIGDKDSLDDLVNNIEKKINEKLAENNLL